MNNRSGLSMFILFLFLAAIIAIQILSMIQMDRQYEHLNRVIKAVENIRFVSSAAQMDAGKTSDEDEYPGDKGDWLVQCINAEPATLFDILEGSGWGARWIVSGTIFESMVGYKPDAFEYEGKLAEEFSISEDGLEIYFKLRDDIHFSDGVPITTDDLIFTLETITNLDIDCHSYANYFRDIDRYERINDREIKFYMKNVYFLSLGYIGGIPIYPKHIYQFDEPKEFNELRTNPVGSGPYVFEKWDVGRQVVLTRNENYWDKKPKIKKRVFRFITNEIAALQSLEAGEVDFWRPMPDQFDEKCSNEEFSEKFHCLSYWSATETGYFWVGWNQARPFFKDKRVRQALTHMIDRKAIRDHILRSSTAEIPTGPFYIHGPQTNPNIEPWPYDLEKAKKLLDEAGWIDTDGDGVRDKDGIAFKFNYMIVGGTPLHEKIVKLVRDAASKIGIVVVPDPYEWSIFSQRAVDRKFDAVNMAWGGNVESDPYQIWHSSQAVKGSNYVGFKNPEADALIEQARMTMDRDERNALYHKFHSILHEEQPYTFIYTRPSERFLDKRFHNVIIHKLGIDELEWYVPKEMQKY